MLLCPLLQIDVKGFQQHDFNKTYKSNKHFFCMVQFFHNHH